MRHMAIGQTWKIVQNNDGKTGDKATLQADGIDVALRTKQGKQSQFLPFASISRVAHTSKRLTGDKLTIQVGAESLDWTVAGDATPLADAINAHNRG